MCAGLCCFLYHRDIYHKKQSIKQLIKVWIQAKATADLDGQVSSVCQAECGEESHQSLWRATEASVCSPSQHCPGKSTLPRASCSIGAYLASGHVVVARSYSAFSLIKVQAIGCSDSRLSSEVSLLSLTRHTLHPQQGESCRP